jgi:hypothetical protein
LLGDKFTDLTLDQLGAWLRLRCGQEMTNEPFTRKAASRLGVSAEIVDVLREVRLLDDLDDDLLTIHDLDENRPQRKPSDAPEAIRIRVAEYRARKAAASVTPSNALQRSPGSGDGSVSLSGEGESEGEQSQPDVTELHPITRQPRKRKPAVTALEGPFPDVALSPSEMLDEDPFGTVYGRSPKPTTVKWYDRLAKTYPGRVSVAMREAINVDPDPGTLLSRTEAILKADKATVAELAKSAEIANATARRRQAREALEARAAAVDPDSPSVRAFHAIGASLPGAIDRSAELKAKCTAKRQADKADKKARREPQSSGPLGELLGLAPRPADSLPADVEARYAPLAGVAV